jgi:hypothetical protein
MNPRFGIRKKSTLFRAFALKTLTVVTPMFGVPLALIWTPFSLDLCSVTEHGNLSRGEH